jgi:CubicO group peptidase (beta-lactamase class C family)
VIIDGSIYLHPPMTRHGIYPYPHEMRHGVFSVTKSLSGSLSMFYLAERYGEDVFEELITDYITVLADHPGWQNVTFSHVLNMVTGVEGNDKGGYITPFIHAPGMDAGIKAISNLKDLPEQPGEKFNYASTNSFVLSYAMQKLVEKKEGKGIYYWDLVHENVLKPIKAESFVLQHTEEPDGSKGIPIIGWGAYPTVDETAKIATLLLNEGRYKNHQLLNKRKVREALYRTDWEGYDSYENRRYNHSFWSRNISIGGCTKRVSYMIGHGGNYVMFLPDNAILIWYIDKMDYAIDPVVRAVGKTITWCD